MPQDSHHLPRGAVSACFGADSGFSEEYETEEGEFTDLSVCGTYGAFTRDIEGSCCTNRRWTCDIQGQTTESHPNPLAAHLTVIPRYELGS